MVVRSDRILIVRTHQMTTFSDEVSVRFYHNPTRFGSDPMIRIACPGNQSTLYMYHQLHCVQLNNLFLIKIKHLLHSFLRKHVILCIGHYQIVHFQKVFTTSKLIYLFIFIIFVFQLCSLNVIQSLMPNSAARNNCLIDFI